MNQYDPTSDEATGTELMVGEVSVEEVAKVAALEAAAFEPDGERELGAAENPDGAIPSLPPFVKRSVSGTYRGASGAFQLELRVDVDRTRPMKRMSGDFFQLSGATTTYAGSFVVDSPTITVSSTQVILKGLGRYTFSAGAPVIKVTIQRRTLFQPAAPALVQFFTTVGSPGATYLCSFSSIYFRSVKIETDWVTDVTTPVFGSYATGSLPSGGPARSLSVAGAYGEAGIQLIPSTAGDAIDISAAGDTRWSNAELHASMSKHFSLWKDSAQWTVWQVVARLHDLGSGLYGIMFDQQGKQRQGCAVFHEGVGGTTADKLRLQLYTYVHELGHCFNLLHSWQKSYATPPQTNRPNAMSWMNYPWYYPGGPAAFWNAFPFQFDGEEIIHLRHGFRNDVIMGGKNFAVGAALGREIMASPLEDESGLRLGISIHQKSFALGEPVVIELSLGTSDQRGRRVHTWLHPNCGLVKIAIKKPSGEVSFYEPLIDHLVGERMQDIGPDEAIRDSAYVGFGRGGLYFDHPGRYQVRAVYASADGSQVMSNLLDVRVRYPVTATDDELADLFMGEEQGTLLYLLGSDADSLRRGQAAFDQVLAKHGNHPLATYARLVKGFNAAREFKTITTDVGTRLMVRKPRADESAGYLKAVADSGVLDEVSANQTRSKLAEAHALTGETRKTPAVAARRTAPTGAPLER